MNVADEVERTIGQRPDKVHTDRFGAGRNYWAEPPPASRFDILIVEGAGSASGTTGRVWHGFQKRSSGPGGTVLDG